MFLFFCYNSVTIHTSEKSSKVQESTIIRFCFIISMTKRVLKRRGNGPVTNISVTLLAIYLLVISLQLR